MRFVYFLIFETALSLTIKKKKLEEQMKSMSLTHVSEMQVIENQFTLKYASTLRTLTTQQKQIQTSQLKLKEKEEQVSKHTKRRSTRIITFPSFKPVSLLLPYSTLF